MKFLSLITSLLFSFTTFSAELIKTKDMKNTVADSMNSSDSHSESITAEEMDKLKKDIEMIKENQKKSEEMLESLEKDL